MALAPSHTMAASTSFMLLQNPTGLPGKNSLSHSLSVCLTINKLPYVLAQATPSLDWRSINRLYKAPAGTAAPETWQPSAATKWPFWKLLNLQDWRSGGSGLDSQRLTVSLPVGLRTYTLEQVSINTCTSYYNHTTVSCYWDVIRNTPSSFLQRSPANKPCSGRVSYVQSNVKAETDEIYMWISPRVYLPSALSHSRKAGMWTRDSKKSQYRTLRTDSSAKARMVMIQCISSYL